MSYFVSTCRSSETDEDEHVSNFVDDFENVACKEINRPLVRHNSCEVFQSTDEHRRMRQNIVGFQKNQLMKDCWVCLLIAVSGLTVVSTHLQHRSKKLKADSIDSIRRRKNETRI